jgi:hypothetical protein
VATARGIDVEEIPRIYGRRKLKTLYKYLNQIEDLNTLRHATGTRAAMGADADGWGKYADALQGGLSAPTETGPPALDLEHETARQDDTNDWEAVDDG